MKNKKLFIGLTIAALLTIGFVASNILSEVVMIDVEQYDLPILLP